MKKRSSKHFENEKIGDNIKTEEKKGIIYRKKGEIRLKQPIEPAEFDRLGCKFYSSLGFRN